jgi:hypothetical protein
MTLIEKCMMEILYKDGKNLLSEILFIHYQHFHLYSILFPKDSPVIYLSFHTSTHSFITFPQQQSLTMKFTSSIVLALASVAAASPTALRTRQDPISASINQWLSDIEV